MKIRSAAAFAIALGLGIAPTVRSQDASRPAEKTVRIHLSDGTMIVGTVLDDGGPVLRVKTAWAPDVAVPRASVVAIEDALATLAARPVSVVRFELDAKGGAAKTEPRLLKSRLGEARAEFRFLVAGRVDGVARADGSPIPFRTDPRPHATLVSVRLPVALEPGESEWIAVRTYDPGAASRSSAAETLFRYRRGAPVDEVAVVQVVLPKGSRLLGAKPEATEVPEGTLVFRKDLAQGETFDVEARFAAAER